MPSRTGLAMEEDGAEEEETWTRGSGEEMDQRRREAMALEYLRRLEEARVWLGDCFGEEEWAESRGVEMEEELRSGVPLARLAHSFAKKELGPKAKVFDPDFARYRATGLHFRHTDNTSQWITAMRVVGLPEIFIPDTSDVYDGKNLPKAVFCLHALSIFLHRKGLAPAMRGAQTSFTAEEVSEMGRLLAERGIKLPPFSRVGGLLAEELSKDESELHAAIAAVNEAIEEKEAEELQQRLRVPAAQITLVRPPRASLYLQRLSQARNQKIAQSKESASEDIYDRNLTRAELQQGVDDINVSEGMAAVNSALESGAGWAEVYTALRDPGLRLPPVDAALAQPCHEALLELRGSGGRRLEYAETKTLLESLAAAAAVSASPDSLQKHLASLRLSGFNPELLQAYKEAIAKEAAEGGGALTPQRIQAILLAVNERSSTEGALGQLTALHGRESEPTREEEEAAWAHLSPKLRAFYAHLIPLYSRRLRAALKGRDPSTLTLSDLQRIVEEVKAEEERAAAAFPLLRDLNAELSLAQPDPHRLQYHLERAEEPLHLKVQPLPQLHAAILKATKASKPGSESWLCYEVEGGEFYWTEREDGSGGVSLDRPAGDSANLSRDDVRSAVLAATESADFYAGRQEEVVKAQAVARMGLARRAYRRRLDFLQSQEEAARKIQSHMKRRQAGLDWRALLASPNPPLPLLRKFLRSSETDYEDEAQLAALRAQLANDAAVCQATDRELHDMDVKIGLLVNNVINLEEVLRQGQKMKAAMEEDGAEKEDSSTRHSKEYSALRRGSRRLDPRLELYQYLLYLLQTQPEHLCRLGMAAGKSPAAAAQSLVLPAFGYAAQRREEFLLCGLLREAISRQAQSLNRPEDFATASIPATVASVCRQMCPAPASPKLGPLIRELLAQPPEKINIDPLEIYEYGVGKPREGLTALEASKDPKVAGVFQRSLEYLEEWAGRFVTALCSEEAPAYPLRLAWRLVHEAAGSRWSESGPRERLKWIGSVWLESWVRPRLLGPEDHGFLNKSAKVSDDQRHILASILKLLSFAVENVGFGGEKAYLAPLNNSIRENHALLRGYMGKLIQVESAEERYGMDELSDVTASRDPSLSISLGALLRIHTALAKDPPPKGSDMAEVLRQLADVPALQALAGIFCEDGVDEASAEKRSVTLHLRPPPSATNIPSLNAQADPRHKFIRAKTALRKIALVQAAPDVRSLLDTPAKTSEVSSFQGDLEKEKEELGELLLELEEVGLVSSASGYQELVSAMAEDVRSESAARQARRAEIERYSGRVEDLARKKAYQREQAKAYDAVIKDCLASLAPKAKDAAKAKAKRMSSASGEAPPRPACPPSKTLKYPGDKLAKKSVLLDVRDVPQKKWSDHKFEITSNDGGPGLFNVHYRIGDKEQDRRINLQELLKLEYDGVESITIFSGVIFALSPLLLLLNRKFHC